MLDNLYPAFNLLFLEKIIEKVAELQLQRVLDEADNLVLF